MPLTFGSWHGGTDAPYSLHWLHVRVFFCISMTRVARWERVVGEGREKEKSLTSTVRLECSCGDTTRTCDLQVMSLASYQLLHSAMYLLIIGRSLMFQKRMQRYGEFLICANFSWIFLLGRVNFANSRNFQTKSLAGCKKISTFAHDMYCVHICGRAWIIWLIIAMPAKHFQQVICVGL